MTRIHISKALLTLTVAISFLFTNGCSHHHNGNESDSSATEVHDYDKHDHDGLVRLSASKARDFGVVAEIIEAGDFSEVIAVSGKIEPLASDEATITASRSGIFNISSSANAGMKVSAGSNIGTIHSSSVQGGDPTLEAAAIRDAAKRELDRLTPLHEDGVVSTQAYNEARSAYEQADAALRNSRQGSVSVVSPKSGVITQIFVKSGQYVEAGQPLAMVSGNTHLTLRADVPEKYHASIHGVETANFRPASSSDAFSLKDLNGKRISSRESSIADNGYIPVYFSFDNDGKVTPGSFAEIYLISGKRQNVISVLKDAIVEIGGNKCLYTLYEDELYEKHLVATGASDGQKVEILSGLKSGEKVVVKGAQIVRMAETSATAVPGHTHNY